MLLPSLVAAAFSSQCDDALEPLSPAAPPRKVEAWADEQDDLADDEGDGKPVATVGKKKKKR